MLNLLWKFDFFVNSPVNDLSGHYGHGLEQGLVVGHFVVRPVNMFFRRGHFLSIFRSKINYLAYVIHELFGRKIPPKKIEILLTQKKC